MPMPPDQIKAAIDDRLTVRWRKRLLEEMAAPIALIGIKQLAGRDFGRPVVVTLQELSNEELGALLIGAGMTLFRQGRLPVSIPGTETLCATLGLDDPSVGSGYYVSLGELFYFVQATEEGRLPDSHVKVDPQTEVTWLELAARESPEDAHRLRELAGRIREQFDL